MTTDDELLTRAKGLNKGPRCAVCGQFVNCWDSSARFHFVPDNHFGPEQNEWVHEKCARAEGKDGE